MQQNQPTNTSDTTNTTNIEIEKPNQVVVNVPDFSQITSNLDLLLLFGLAGGFLYKRFVQPSVGKFKDNIGRSVKTDERIKSVLNQILSVAEADRVIVCQAHNGEVFLSGSHQWKVSITHEATKAGINSCASEFQNVRASHISNLLKALIEKKAVYKTSTLSSSGDSKIRTFASLAGVISSVNILLGDPEENILGILSVHYVNDASDFLKTFDTAHLDHYISEVEGLLQVKENKWLTDLLSFHRSDEQ